jgi:type II secretory pathway predicted ATPase ExeA/predicted regulator of Ras-like GTPase activity (Roadblock/LC7/MglB family)
MKKLFSIKQRMAKMGAEWQLKMQALVDTHPSWPTMTAQPDVDAMNSPQSELPERPFDWNGPTEFFFSNTAFSQAEKGIASAIRLSPGLIVLTGEGGTGKTLLVSRVIGNLPATVTPLLLRDPRISFDEFIEFACQQFNLEPLSGADDTPSTDRAMVLRNYLLGQHQQGMEVAVFIDEAHEMTEALLAALLQFSVSQAQGEKLLQIVLVGSPNLEQLLLKPSLIDLSHERVMLSLSPLQSDEVGAFIRQRIAGLNALDKGGFSDEAISKIALYSRGVPRLINTICGLAMFEAQFENRQGVTGEIIDAVAKPFLLLSKPKEQACEIDEENVPIPDIEAYLTAQPNPGSAPNIQATYAETKAPTIHLAELGQRQEYTMSRLDNLNKILRHLQSESPGVEASALISEDGLMIASSLPQDLEETRVAGMTATLLNLGTRAAVELRRGEVQEVIVRGEQGYAVMISAGRGVLLLVLANETSKLGLIFFDMREAIKGIKHIL